MVTWYSTPSTRGRAVGVKFQTVPPLPPSSATVPATAPKPTRTRVNVVVVTLRTGSEKVARMPGLLFETPVAPIAGIVLVT